MTECSKQICVDRRRALGLVGLGMAAAIATPGIGSTMATAAPATALSSEQALAGSQGGQQALRLAAAAVHARTRQAARRASPQHQAPWAIIVGCADSRSPPELLFGGLGVGQLFVARNAGNLIDPRWSARSSSARPCSVRP